MSNASFSKFMIYSIYMYVCFDPGNITGYAGRLSPDDVVNRARTFHEYIKLYVGESNITYINITIPITTTLCVDNRIVNNIN